MLWPEGVCVRDETVFSFIPSGQSVEHQQRPLLRHLHRAHQQRHQRHLHLQRLRHRQRFSGRDGPSVRPAQVTHGEERKRVCVWRETEWDLSESVCVPFIYLLQVQKLQDVHVASAGAVLLPRSGCQWRAGERRSSGFIWDLSVVHADRKTAGGTHRITFITIKYMYNLSGGYLVKQKKNI